MSDIIPNLKCFVEERLGHAFNFISEQLGLMYTAKKSGYVHLILLLYAQSYFEYALTHPNNWWMITDYFTLSGNIKGSFQ